MTAEESDLPKIDLSEKDLENFPSLKPQTNTTTPFDLIAPEDENITNF